MSGSGAAEVAVEDGWNHNIHYQRVVLDAVPPGATRALDAGCGEGTLADDLARAVPHVVGLDADAEVLERTHARLGGHVQLVRGDVLTHRSRRRRSTWWRPSPRSTTSTLAPASRPWPTWSGPAVHSS